MGRCCVALLIVVGGGGGGGVPQTSTPPGTYLYHSNTTTDLAMQKTVKGFTAYPDGILRLAEVSKQQGK